MKASNVMACRTATDYERESFNICGSYLFVGVCIYLKVSKWYRRSAPGWLAIPVLFF